MDPVDTARANRAVRLFVSSTFSDMQPERRVLVERVFPQVREWCQARGVSFTEIDLRWGITEEQSRAGNVLRICLNEVDACRPFFLGLLGGRYGSLATQFSPELLIAHPWLAGLENRSYTELEFLRALWPQEPQPTMALVYERDPVLDAQREPPGAESARRLNTLKARARADMVLARPQPYRSPDELGSWVLEDLKRGIEAVFPEATAESPAERERESQRWLRRVRGRRYIGPRASFQRLDAHALGDSAPLLVCAPPGAGKSALLAAWAGKFACEFQPALHLTDSLAGRLTRWWRPAKSPPPATGPIAPIVFCGVGATPRTESWSGIARFVCEELRHRLGLTLPVPDPSIAAESILVDFLLAAAQRGRVVVVLDGLDHLGATEADRAVAWLPARPSASLRLIVSAAPGAVPDRLRARGCDELRLPEWGQGERRLCVAAFGSEFGKRFAPALEQPLLEARQTGNPLFLCTMLEELRVGASHEDLPAQVAAQLAAPDVPALFGQMFRRFERSFEEDRPRLVGECLGLLASARRGLQESEMRELLGAPGQPLAARLWSPLASALRPHLTQREGLLALDSLALRQAAEHSYLSSRTDRARAHGRLAGFFAARLPAARGLEELPWQLLWSGRIEELAARLGDPAFLAAAWRHDREEVLRVSGELCAGGMNLGAMLAPYAESLGSQLDSAEAAAGLLFALGEAKPSACFAAAALRHTERLGDTARADELAGKLALLDHRNGNLDAAERRLGGLAARARARGERTQLALHLGNRGAVLRELGRLDEARVCFQEEESLCRGLRDPHGHAAAIGHLGQTAFDRREFAEALGQFEEQITRCRRLADVRQLQSALGNAAACHAACDRLEAAMSLHREEEEICRRRGDRHALQVCLGNQVRLLQRFREADYDRAMKLLEEREALAKELGDPAAEAATLLQFSRIYHALSPKQFDDAVRDYAERAAAVARRHGLRKLAAEADRWLKSLDGAP